MLIQLFTAILSLVFSAEMFWKYGQSRDVKKLIMAVVFLTGFVTIICASFYSIGPIGSCPIRHAGAIVIPFGLLVIALLFTTNYTKSLLALFLAVTVFSFYAALEKLETIIILSSFLSSITAIILFSLVFVKTRAKKMLWFILSMVLFTIGPVFAFVLNYGVIIHYIFISIGLLILFIIFNK